jgi:hypothetical protein
MTQVPKCSVLPTLASIVMRQLASLSPSLKRFEEEQLKASFVAKLNAVSI